MVGMYAAGVTYEVTGKGFDPEALGGNDMQSLEAVESHREFRRWVKCSAWDPPRTLAKTWAARLVEGSAAHCPECVCVCVRVRAEHIRTKPRCSGVKSNLLTAAK